MNSEVLNDNGKRPHKTRARDKRNDLTFADSNLTGLISYRDNLTAEEV